MSFEEFKKEWEGQEQGQVFHWSSQQSDDDKHQLLNDLNKINIKEVNNIYKKIINDKINEKVVLSYQGFDNVKSLDDLTAEDTNRWQDIGYDLIAEGKVGILLLAGGQATRLGTTFPKGFYDVGLPSKKSLFRLQAERVVQLQKLVQQQRSTVYKETRPIQWYIMTSEATHHETIKYFKDYDYFGLRESSFFFFAQSMIPCLTPEGKVINETSSKISLSPNGNGGLFQALRDSGALNDMKTKGITHITQYCVDNILIKMADPVFVGYMYDQGADCAAKVVSKVDPEEPVGVMALQNGKPFVLEYSEIDKESKYLKHHDTGKLVYNYAHICINAFTYEFLQRIADKHLDDLKYHVAFKKIPYADTHTGQRTVPTQNNGWKLEKFIFDVFPFCNKMVCLEIDRKREFSPLKNSAGMAIPADSPETCLRDLCQLHRVFIESAGGKVDITESQLIEISPLVSYFGENLESIVKDKIFTLPYEISTFN
ncbi:UDP-N-acetylglucosamine pyrophosphorylase [Tieghemostelium lacteum]|uniref:UDP-N-acetylglucosamine diphosphorylase n=1 Tax=Tieghemostelium lacteum TaxID=361077 RepID=A0A152A0S8_TIELA|nr:UDP-N-acetylglucosamine pyrophosphorylase [Tieghemostelium lacteum]|eukprot:KYQ99819.1 UDP-N-acetylglucosamine pyrophosphorylase [Tieghemostelium lacteum]